MSDTSVGDLPWQGDACGLVEAFRSSRRSPSEELEATLAAIERSDLNAFAFLDVDGARASAAVADVTLPFGGVPLGIKELDKVAGWPDTEASIPLSERKATYTLTHIERLVAAGAVPVGMTTASEFGGVNLTRTMLHGTTHNPWRRDHTPGGSSGGSAAAVAGGLLSLATGGDGGGSIRIPAGFCGLVGLKATYGRIPRGPHFEVGALTVTVGGLTRSVRDTARWLDATNGAHRHDPHSLPRVEGWERGLGTHLEDLRGLRVAVVDRFAGAVVGPATAEVVRNAAEQLIADLGLRRVDLDVAIPNVGAAWSLANLASVYGDLGDAWPACAGDLTPEIRYSLEWGDRSHYDMAARIRLEQRRTALFEAMATMFDQTDLVITSSNPDTAFAADGPLPHVFGGIEDTPANNGKLTIPSNLYGNPAISIPVGFLDGLPVGMQVLAPHHTEALLLDAAWVVERERPWPLVAP
ncbi:MAG: amidase [Microthrixaceae bacterium]|nr:amidase [Microthrixaceae bacterium]